MEKRQRNPRKGIRKRYEGQASGGGQGVFVADRNDVVHDLEIEVARHEASAGALNLVRARLHRFAIACLRDDGGVFGLHRNGAEGFFAGLDDFAHAGNGATGAHCGHQDVGLATGVVPDFLGSCLAMNLGVGQVGKLLRD